VRWDDNIEMDIKSRLDRKVWLRIRATGDLLPTWYSMFMCSTGQGIFG
jgi:hypothetical protein